MGFRAIGKGHTAALKLLSLLNLGGPISRARWTSHTSALIKISNNVAEQNMKQAAEEVKNLTSGSSNGTVDIGTSFDCSWNSRGWQAREGVVAAIAVETGKIIDIVHKCTSCPNCKVKQTARDNSKMSGVEFMEWFINHEPSCFLNHSGSPQVL